MTNYLPQMPSSMFFIFISCVYISYLVLRTISNSDKSFLSILHVKAEKSQTNALLLGGLALSLSFFSTVGFILYFYPQNLSKIEYIILKASLFPVALVTFYGLLDDKFEIRARHKLFLQIISIVSFVVPVSTVLYQNNPFIIAVSLIFGLAYINGSNLIDGLDTIFAKVGIVTSLGFLFLSIKSQSFTGIGFSMLTIGSLISFYYYNKEPARIYAGEIGGSLLGMIFFIQANMLLGCQLPSISVDQNSSMLFQILIVSIYPLSELGITFSRRIFYKQSPFRGDHLHIHHILKARFNLNASQTANIVSTVAGVTILMGLLISHNFLDHSAFAVTFFTHALTYCLICFRHWKKTYSRKDSNEIFLSFDKKIICVIDGRAIDLLYGQYQLSASNKDDIAV